MLIKACGEIRSDAYMVQVTLGAAPDTLVLRKEVSQSGDEGLQIDLL